MVATANSNLFKKGQSGNPAGRVPGSKNKIRFDFVQTCSDEKFNPCLELIKIVRTPGASVHARVAACSEICSYIQPKLKAIEITADEAIEKFNLNFTVIGAGDIKLQDGVNRLPSNKNSK